jgi:type IV pilus assembly protein PilW
MTMTMTMSSTTTKAQRGFTLVELMVSMVVSMILVGAGFSMAATVMGTYRDHKRVVLIERAARVSLDIVGDAIRNASPGVATGNLGDLVGCGPSGAVRVTDKDDGPDELEVIYGSGGSLTSLRAEYVLSSTGLQVTDGAGFAIGDLVVISNLDQGHVVAVTDISEVDGDTFLVTGKPDSLCATPGLPADGYPAGSLVVRARMARFFIGTAGGAPTLMVDPDGDGKGAPEPLAPGVEDFQVAVGVDGNDDGTVVEAASSTDEWFGNVSGDPAAPAVDAADWRAVRLSLTARTMVADAAGSGTPRPPLENHDGDSALDGFRRRSLSATFEIRNLTGSP